MKSSDDSLERGSWGEDTQNARLRNFKFCVLKLQVMVLFCARGRV